MASMNNIPAELLSIILRLADPQVDSESDAEGDLDIHEIDETESDFKRGVGDLLPPYHFPFNLANVCTVWRDVLSRYPEYWTNLYVLVDATHPTAFSELALYLQYSKDLALKLIVTRSPVSAASSSLHKEDGTRVQSVIKMLRPHFPRCTSISFDLHRGSALPSLSGDLAVRSPDLSTLVLSCEVDDAHPPMDTHAVDFVMKSSLQEESSDHANTPSPALRRLELSGYTIMDAIQHSFSLFASETQVMDVTLSTYNLTTDLEHKHSEHITRTFFQALDVPGVEDKLTLQSINLPCLGDGNYLFIGSKGHLHLINLGSEMMKNILMQVDLEQSYVLTVENCDLDNDECKPCPYEIHLNLIDINPDTNLCRFFKYFSMGILTVVNCNSFDDDVIRLLARRRDNGGSFLEELEVTACSRVSAAALRELARSGESSSVKMKSISVCAPGQQISAQEVEALEEEFPHVFRWITSEDEGSSISKEVI